MKTFFTSDTHFGHTNIVKHCHRPFLSIEEHDETLIQNWNLVVQPQDTVFHLGDFTWHNDAAPILARLNGKIHFILGNHDRAVRRCIPPLIWIKDVREVSVDGQSIWLSHYSHRVWPHSHHGAWHFYGHSHNTLPDDPNALSMDVGVDSAHARLRVYRPFEFSELVQVMKQKKFVPLDHHGAAPKDLPSHVSPL